MLSWSSSTWLGRLDTPSLWRGFQYGRLVAMALLTSEEDKDAIEVDGSIIEAPFAHPTRLQRLQVCMER